MSTETLRPNAAGTITELTPSGGANYSCVDEAVANDDTDYVRNNSTSETYLKDTYNIPNSSIGTGTINSVTVYCRSRKEGSTSYAYPVIRTHDTYYYGSALTLTTSYQDHSKEWTTNPNTGLAWTWDEINALEIGVYLVKIASSYKPRCTQVYVVIDYTVSGWANIAEITGVASADVSEMTGVAKADIAEITGIAV